VISVAVVLCASLAAWGVGKSGGMGCLHRPFHGAVSVRQIDGECVGYSDDATFKFNDEPGQTALRNIQERIFAQNRQVDEDWGRSGRRRPYVTLVYLGTLTGRAVRANEEAYAAEREELEGLAVAQYDGLQEPGSAYGKPLLHVVIANAGFQMRHVGAATDMVADLARRDPTPSSTCRSCPRTVTRRGWSPSTRAGCCGSPARTSTTRSATTRLWTVTCT
jgi:hypothetical protein